MPTHLVMSSEFTVFFLFSIENIVFQMGFQRTNGFCWLEKHRCYLLYEFVSTNNLFYQKATAGMELEKFQINQSIRNFQAVYALPTDSDDQLHSIPLALQKLFYDLQFTDRPVSTKKLTRSFGYDLRCFVCTIDQLLCHLDGINPMNSVNMIYKNSVEW